MYTCVYVCMYACMWMGNVLLSLTFMKSMEGPQPLSTFHVTSAMTNAATFTHQVLRGEGLSGALYWSDFQRLMREAGLSAWGTTSVRKLNINNDDVAAKVGPIGFYSVTVRAVKVAPSHSSDYPEDYGQVGVVPPL